MAKHQRASKFLFIGNDPCLDFLNTEIASKGVPVDLLATYDDLAAWLVESGQLDNAGVRLMSGQLSEAEKHKALADAKALREVLRRMVQQVAEGGTVPQEAVEAINERLRGAAGYRELVPSDSRHFTQRFVSAAAPRPTLVATLAMTAGHLLCSADLGLVKKCRNPACVLYFYDTTKNHARNWCSMQVCGNREKVAAYFKRRRQERRRR